MALTKGKIDKFVYGGGWDVRWDNKQSGFGVRIYPPNSNGVSRKSFVYSYRFKGKKRLMVLGQYGKMTLDQAKKKLRACQKKLDDGIDPLGERDAARRAALDPGARFEKVVEEFIEKHARPRQRTWEETQRTLKTNCADWLSRPISSITKADAYDLLDGFIADGNHSKARVTHAWLRDMFRWAVKRDILDASVVEGVDIEIERKVRTRFYNDNEIPAVWKGADTLESSEGAYVKLILLLCVRKGELAGMRRSEFDNPDAPTLWTVPHERTKSRKLSKRERVYFVPLPSLAQRIIRGALRDGEDIVFPGRHEETTIDPGTWLRTKVRRASGVADWSFHPCRDTTATWLKDQGHSEYERGLVLNHSEHSVTGDYSHGYPIELKRMLLEKWADHVAELVQPEGAVLLS